MIKSDSNPHPLCDAPKIKASTMHITAEFISLICPLFRSTSSALRNDSAVIIIIIITAESLLSALEVHLRRGLLGLVHIRLRLGKISVQ